MKKTVKKVGPVYTVDLTDIRTTGDVYYAFVDAKVTAGEPIRPYELYMYFGAYQNEVIAPTLDAVVKNVHEFLTHGNQVATAITDYIDKKNTPWYKKVWRKVTNLFHGK